VLVELYDKINYSLLKIPLHFPKLFDTTGEMLLTCAEGIADRGRSIFLLRRRRRSSYVVRMVCKELFTDKPFCHCVLRRNDRPLTDGYIGGSH
jgi:hypothetical protein